MFRRPLVLAARLLPVAALLLSVVLSLGSVAAAAPTVTANPALVPFDTTPGKPGTTTLTFAAGGSTGLTACGQDNANLPFKLGAVDPTTPLVVPFPFIQAGTYTFWVSAAADCTSAKQGTATVARLGPTGKTGGDDVQFRQTGETNIQLQNTGGTSNVTSLDIAILGDSTAAGAKQQTFPIPGVQLCMMSGDGTQQTIAMKVGQDPRTGTGLGTSAATTTVMPIAGQNGCFPIPWVVNGGYQATITRSGASSTFGFCGSLTGTPSNGPTASGIGKCAQVAFSPTSTSSGFTNVPRNTTITGSIVTGADDHAVQVCVAAFTPNPIGVPDVALANTVNAYNQSGAVNLTPLALTFPSRTAVKVQTFDITGPGPGGTGGAQFTCPTATASQSSPGGGVTTIMTTAPAGTTIIDTKFYTVQ